MCCADGLLHSIIRWKECVRLTLPLASFHCKCISIFQCPATVYRLPGRLRNACRFVFFVHVFPSGKKDLSVCNIQMKKRNCHRDTEKNIYLIWNWVCSCECMPQTTVSLQADILFRASDTLQRLLGEMIHVFFTAVGMNVPCGCLVNHDSSLERSKLSQSYQEVPFSSNIIITINMPCSRAAFLCTHIQDILFVFSAAFV